MKRLLKELSVLVFGCVMLVLGFVVAVASPFLGANTQPSSAPVQNLDKPKWAVMDSAGHNETDTGSVHMISDSDTEPSGSDWRLILVNRWNPLPEPYDVTIKELRNGQAVDARCYPDLQEMMDACRAAGLQPLICSSYRTREYQEQLFQNKIDRLRADGYTEMEAAEQAGTEVAVPGTSEHQLGLAVDIVDIANQNLDETQEQTDVQRWLIENSYKYGFILRYPSDKCEITGIIYEPWHYRYVGRDAAWEMYEQGICLEEYLDSVSNH